eukprot:3469392-Amphidinium_carterae.1
MAFLASHSYTRHESPVGLCLPCFDDDDDDDDVLSHWPNLTVNLARSIGFASIIMGRPGTFAVNFTLGNLFMLAASFFFSNPRAQCRKLRYKNRGRIFFTYVLRLALAV